MEKIGISRAICTLVMQNTTLTVVNVKTLAQFWTFSAIAWAVFGSGLVLLVSCLRRTADKYQDVCVATFITGFMIALAPLAPVEGWLRPLTWDSRLRSVDLTLGLDGFAFARFCIVHRWPMVVLMTAYAA